VPTAGIVPIVALLVGFEVYCLVEVVRRDANLLPKWLWAIITLASVPLGGILYLVLGRSALATHAPMSIDVPVPPPAPVSWPPSTTSTVRPTGGGPPTIRISDLAKRYGDVDALSDVSMEVARGSVFGIVGPNGAGKTTLLSMLAGLRSPTGGSIELSVPRDRVSLLPDTPSFEPWLTAREVVDLARTLSPRAGDASATDAALARVGLVGAADRRTDGFSRGMLQRLGLAATIVGDPELLLLDEPCSALDPVGRREVLDLVGRLGVDHTVVFCSHILDDVQEVCDSVGVLRDGRVLFQGALDDLLVGQAAPTYVLRARPPLSPLIELLAREPWVVSVEQLGAEELEVRVTSLQGAQDGLVAALARAHAQLISVVPKTVDLEQVFLELVR
jgi:ABC-2 type transport system ATP-binding protein